MPKESFEGLRTRLLRESTQSYWDNKQQQMIANWTQGLFNAFGESKALEILKATEKLDRKELLELIQTRDDFSISFMYEDISVQDKYEYLLEELSLL